MAPGAQHRLATAFARLASGWPTGQTTRRAAARTRRNGYGPLATASDNRRMARGGRLNHFRQLAGVSG